MFLYFVLFYFSDTEGKNQLTQKDKLQVKKKLSAKTHKWTLMRRRKFTSTKLYLI